MLIDDEVLAGRPANYALQRHETVMLRTVLRGNYPECNLVKMSGPRLENLVSQLVRCTADVSYVGPQRGSRKEVRWRKPKWWPSELAYGQPISSLRNKPPYSMNWCAMLRELISKCSQFYKAAPLNALKCCNRVYYYGVLRNNEEDYENVAERGTKRKAVDDCVWVTPKRKRLESRKPESDKKVLSEKTTSNVTPVVRLCDILKGAKSVAAAKPVERDAGDKNDFMSYLNLQGQNPTAGKQIPAPKPLNIKLHQVPHIPLSSEAGRLLMKRDYQPIPQELRLRRIERIEWHLSHNAPRATSKHKQQADYEVTYDGRRDNHHAHAYKFPKRQHHQRRPSLHEPSFILSVLCRRVLTVRLARDDLLELKRRLCAKKKLSVALVNMDLSAYQRHVFEDEVVDLSEDDEEDCVIVISEPSTPRRLDHTQEEVIVID